MSDERDEAQRKADAALEAAIEESARAYGETGLLMEWVVITAHHSAGEEGDTYTAVNYTVSDDLPYYRMLGLLEFAQHRTKQAIDDGTVDY